MEQVIAAPEPASDADEADPLPDIRPGGSIPGTRISSQGEAQPEIACPAGSAPSVVGNDSFRGILIWECVKTWREYEAPTTPAPDDGGESEGGEASNELPEEVSDALSGVLEDLGGEIGASTILSSDQSARRDAEAVSAVVGVRTGNVIQATLSAKELTTTYQSVLAANQEEISLKRLEKQLQTSKIDSDIERDIRRVAEKQARKDLQVVFQAANIERAAATSRGLVDDGVQSILGKTIDDEAERAALLSLRAGDLPAVAGVLRTEEKVPRVEYQIAEALSRNDFAEARSLAKSVNRFESSIVGMALQEMLESQGQSSGSAKVAAAKALSAGRLRSGAWYAFQGTAVQKCESTGCAWLGNVSG
ncbi:hypothetical protein OAV85_02455 [Candidatus Nanopelagicales bacterium]|nr:hypothetical protein [Candidatus Nanopelagicales bacterium]